MRKKILIYIGLITLVIGFSRFAISEIEAKAKDDLYKQVELFSYALTTIQSEYAEEPKPKDLIYGALKGLLASLDPHSQFMDPETYNELKVETEGQFGGLGIEITLKDGLVTVITPVQDTPAWKAGIKAGDKIVKINDEIARDFTLNDAVKRLRGKPATVVNILVLREGEDKLLEFKITREIIKIHDIKEARILEERIGYIRLAEFRENTPADLTKALESVKKDGADSLILDLRNNPGGLLNIAIKISEIFLPEGKVIVSTKGRHSNQDMVFKSRSRNSDYLEWPMVVLINEGSASGSEILAGSLQDNKRAIILGTKSFGKGSVQSVIPLFDGSAIRLTTSKYFTPSGRSIHGLGILPDVAVEDVELVEKEKDDKLESLLKEKEVEKPKSEISDKQKDSYKKDRQISSAIDIIKGIRIFKQQTAK
ncbi:MAG: S41 family peptidase [Candidatus Omnitrophota bacterium]|nr:S41 family peptidase [Candidatus Omnitrophota bacterium]